MEIKQTESNENRIEEGTAALKDLKRYLKSANIQNEENWRLRTLLNRLGLTKYESEAYIGLVQGGSLTVKHLVQQTGIPQSRSYDTLGRLVKYGMVEQTPQSDKNCRKKEKRFRAVEPEVAVQNLFSFFSYAKDEAIAELQKIKSQKNKSSQIWEIYSKKNIIRTAQNLIKSTNYEILIITDLTMLEKLKDEILQAKDKGINITCITNPIEDSDYNLGLNWNGCHRIKTLIDFPMPYIISDHQQALVWTRDLFESNVNSEYVVAQFIEGREWVSTLADHFFITHWNMGQPITTNTERIELILPRTFVHIHTALAEVEYLLTHNIVPYADVIGTNNKEMKVTVSGEIIKIKKEWNLGISTLIIKPDNCNGDIEVSVGGKYAVYEDIRMNKIIIDKG